MDERDSQFLLNEKYGGIQTPEYEKDLARLAGGEPVDYVIGWKPFLDCKIFLDSHPLIPRAETEYWVERAIAEIRESKKADASTRHLDLFAGSGAIGIAVLKHLPQVGVDFGEIDAAHPPTILKNIRENGIDESRASIIETDVWGNIQGTYDFVFANPPYLSQSRREKIQDSVLAYEPGVALFAAEDGLAIIRKTVEKLREHLSPAGALYLEHEPEQSDLISKLASENGLSAETRTDQFGLPRYSVISVA
jgi:release factor glutamine methyltransferase